MATDLQHSPVLAPRPGAGVSAWSRVYGFGSVYAKTLRDSRLAFLIMAGLLAGLALAAGAGIGTGFSTQASRDEMARLASDLPPILAGFAGKAVNVATLGGYLSWKYGPFFAIIAALWSIFAMSGTLATEARRGSLEFVATAPFGKRRLALEKVGAHLTVVTAVMVLLAISTWVACAAFGTLPGDAIPAGAAIGFALWVGLTALAAGGLAFALAPFIGRAGAAGIAGFVVLAGYTVNGYQDSVPPFAAVANLSWFSWTRDHLPLAGQYDWISLVPVAILVVVLFTIGVEAFARRDLGASNPIRTPGMPGALLGLRRPAGRAFGERLPRATGWAIGVGIFGLVIAAASRSFADELNQQSPELVTFLHTAFPAFDVTSAGGLLQLIFVQFGFIIVGFAAATLVSGWASDETSGRLEMLLATPLARRSWAVSGAIGVYAAIAVMTIVVAIAVGIGAAIAGSDALTPMAGSLTLGLYTAALAGIGFAVGGFVRTSIAAEVVAVIVTATFLIDLLAPALKLPDWVHQLALTAHMGQPMVGLWDVPGMAACAILAVGGLALGGIGMQRRDVGR